MTKSEFDSKFNTSYKSAVLKYSDSQALKNALTGSDGVQDSSELLANLAALIVNINKDVLHSLLIDILPLDD